MVRILVVDDEQDLTWALERSLRDEGHEVLTAHNGGHALDLAQRFFPEMVILDVVMPGMDGLEVCRRLRRDPALTSVPVLFLTVRDRVSDRLKAWEEGCDAYLAKPFDMRELKAHVRALARRAQTSSQARPPPGRQAQRLSVGSLTLDLQRHRAAVGDRIVELTPIEFGLLCHLMAHPGQVFSCQELSREVWGYELTATGNSAVRWHIRNLRQKLEANPADPAYICTLPRHGYYLAEDA
jgi:DNA-binding response OmpR family regulator